MKVKFVTFGCSRNQADTELMKGFCRHEIVDVNPDVTVVNTCFVKAETEKKILKLLHELEGKVVVAGCLAQARPQLIEAFPQHSFLGVNALERVNEAIEGQVVDVGPGNPDFCQDRVLANPLISIVPISDGCLGSCTYCCTKQARGNLKSRPVKSILKQFRQDLAKGVREFWLTGQDTGCYGFDINSSLPELLNLVTKLKGDFRVRVGMMNPEHALKLLPDLKDSFKSPKLYKFLHLPVQSGSDRVLKDMNRGYTVNDFIRLIDSFNGFTISTDVICGYPTETDSDWVRTIKFFKLVKPRVLNISRFYARPGTKASYLKQLPSRVSKDRSRELSKLYSEFSLKHNHSLIGSEVNVLVTEPGVGRDQYYRLVNVDSSPGVFVKAKIVSVGVHHLKAKPL